MVQTTRQEHDAVTWKTTTLVAYWPYLSEGLCNCQSAITVSLCQYYGINILLCS